MLTHPAFRLLFLLLLLPPVAGKSQDTVRRESQVLEFRQVGIADTTKAMLTVVLNAAEDGEPILGATVLLRRDTDKMHGKVTRKEGRCNFTVAPGTYGLRVQMTGLKALEYLDMVLEAGQVYELRAVMAEN
jgi:hypothetical protein